MRELTCDACGRLWDERPGLTHCPGCGLPLRRVTFLDEPPGGCCGGLAVALGLAGVVALAAWWAFRPGN